MSSRAFYLGLITLSVLYVTFLAVRYFQTKNKLGLNNIAAYFVSLIVALLIFSIVQKFHYPDNADRYNKSFTSRLATATGEDNSVGLRLKFWDWTFDLIKENPVLGVGLGNWKIVILEKENPPKLNFTYQNKVHNDFLEVSAESGLLAGFVFSSIFVIVFFIFIKTVYQIKSKGEIKYYFLPAFGLLAYIFDAFFNFPQDRPQIQALFALYAGMGVAFSFEFSKKIKDNNRYIKQSLTLNKKWGWLIPAFVIILISVTGYILVLNFKSLKLQRIFKEEEVTGRIKTNSAFFINQFPSIPNLSSTGVPINLQIARKLTDEKQYNKVKELLTAENPSPFDSRREYFLAHACFQLNQVDSALNYIQQAYRQKPLYFDYTELYCKILEALGRENEAISLLDTFLIDNKEEKQAWQYKAAYFYKLGEKQEAVEIMDSAYLLFPDDTSVIRQRDSYSINYLMPYYQEAIRLYNAKNYDEAIKLFKMSEEGYEKLK